MKNLILAIESSCDDSSVALFVEDKVVAEATLSSILEQQKFGGVVPEIASREHLKNIHQCFVNCFINQDFSLEQIGYIVYTEYPGLVGSLHIGVLFAKFLAQLLQIPAIPVNHLCGHIFSAFINNAKNIQYPFLSLIVSGGNSIIYKVDSPVNYSVLNQTADNAIGEVYDKVARALGWKYPGGPEIDKKYDPAKTNITFLKKMPPAEQNFSFSGLKTAVLNYLNQVKMKKENFDEIAIASSFQKTAVEIICAKLKHYLAKYNLKTIVLGGGVSANQLLRYECQQLCDNLYLPELKYTGDNATMIGFYGYLLLNFNKKR